MFVYKFPFGPLGTNALLIGSAETKKGAAIDPSPGSTGALVQKAADLGITIEKILLTHSHWDHIADVKELKAKTNAPLYVHPLDAGNVIEPGSDGLSIFIDIPGVTPDYFFNDGDVIDVGGLKLEVIHTPGHSPGGVCFYLAEHKLLISGDTLFDQCCGKVDLPTGYAEDMWVSLKKLANLPPDTRVIPGHGKDTTIGKENWLSRAKEMFEGE